MIRALLRLIRCRQPTADPVIYLQTCGKPRNHAEEIRNAMAEENAHLEREEILRAKFDKESI